MDATTVGPSPRRRVRDDDRVRRRPRAIDRRDRSIDPSSSRDRSIDRSVVVRVEIMLNKLSQRRTDQSIAAVRSFVRSFVRGTYLHRQSQRPSSRQRVLVRSHRIRATTTTTRVEQSSGSGPDPRVARRPSLVGKMDTDATSRLSVSQWWVFNHSLVV